MIPKKIEYPKCMYDATGDSVTVHNEEQEKAHAERGWKSTPPPKPPVEIPQAAMAAAAAQPAAAFGVPAYEHQRAIERIMSVEGELQKANQTIESLRADLQAKEKELEETKNSLDLQQSLTLEAENKLKAAYEKLTNTEAPQASQDEVAQPLVKKNKP